MEQTTARLSGFEGLRGEDGRDLAAAVGCLALFAAILLALLRIGNEWADFPLWLLLAVPAAFLLAGARFGGLPGRASDPAVDPWDFAPWRVAFALCGLVLLGLALMQTTLLLGDEEVGSVTGTWVLLVVGGLAAGLASRADSRGATFLACVALGGAVFTFADWVSDGIGMTGVRNLFLAEGIVFLLAARFTRPTRIRHSHLLVAVATVALLAGAVIGTLDGFDPSLIIFSGLESAPEIGGDGWELIIIAVSIGALVYAARESARGPAYAGILGLLTFLGIVEDGSLSGWPIALAALAVAGIAYGLAPRTGSTPAAPAPARPPAGGTPPPAGETPPPR